MFTVLFIVLFTVQCECGIIRWCRRFINCFYIVLVVVLLLLLLSIEQHSSEDVWLYAVDILQSGVQRTFCCDAKKGEAVEGRRKATLAQRR